MMLDLVVETACNPAEQVADDRQRGSDVNRCAQLVHGEILTSTGHLGIRLLGDIDTVGELEDDGEHETNDTG